MNMNINMYIYICVHKNCCIYSTSSEIPMDAGMSENGYHILAIIVHI